MALTRMIFAIQMTDPKPTRLRVSGDVGTPAPAMTLRRRGDSEPSPLGCVDGAWTMDLDAGDYLIEISVENRIAGRPDIVTELASGQRSPLFVYYGPLPQSPQPVGLAAWEATVRHIEPPVLLAGDSKDPWPPPPPPPPSWVPLSPISEAWFTAELAAARSRIVEELAAAGGKAPPTDVLDAFVTER